jgi:hypothetical protein
MKLTRLNGHVIDAFTFEKGERLCSKYREK